MDSNKSLSMWQSVVVEFLLDDNFLYVLPHLF